MASFLPAQKGPGYSLQEKEAESHSYGFPGESKGSLPRNMGRGWPMLRIPSHPPRVVSGIGTSTDRCQNSIKVVENTMRFPLLL